MLWSSPWEKPNLRKVMSGGGSDFEEDRLSLVVMMTSQGINTLHVPSLAESTVAISIKMEPRAHVHDEAKGRATDVCRCRTSGDDEDEVATMEIGRMGHIPSWNKKH
ncbi:hypothetical protein VNO77_33768 [Canavalia gladiata]|uniref:Uncharacterized protein n=1 Tax=Canavalia gladiata TaxID=3824 RepID=A0AAN9PY03_CANGL